MSEFNVIFYDFNRKKFIPYNVIPYLVDCYNKAEDKPVTFEEFKKFVKDESMYQFWSRCEYEIILESWPISDIHEKTDIYQQIMMNIDIVTEVLMKSI